MTEKSKLRALTNFVMGGEAVSSGLDVFHFDDGRPNFESLCGENGFRFWLASTLKEALGYTNMKPVTNAVNRAMSACAQLNISIADNFVETTTADGGRDWKLSRFACYLTVMNGDTKNAKVAAAQAYFVTIAEAFRQYVQEADDVERVNIRGEMSEREKSLSATASVQGVENYAFFQSAGYRGMYNMGMDQLKRRKGVPAGRSPLDFMGKTELAANLFRLTQTEERVRNEDIRGQRPLERAAEHVGKKVRSTMIELSGTAPEALPPATDLRDVKKGLKKAGKEYAKLDKRKSDAK